MTDPIRIGISACLLGENVRFDGGHKRDPFLVETLGRCLEWVGVCPEVEMGLGVPRETLRLVQIGGGVRMVMPKTRKDHTARMHRWAAQRLRQLAGQDLCGYILKKDSPSCGLERVKVYGRDGMPHKTGRGLFAAALLEHFPDLPVEEEGRLRDPRIRDNFIERVFAYRRLRWFFARRWTVKGLAAFHTAHQYQLLAHSPQAYKALSRMVAAARGTLRQTLRREYEEQFMRALKAMATTRRNRNVLPRS